MRGLRGVREAIAQAGVVLMLVLSTTAVRACALRVQVPTLESFSHIDADGQRAGYAVEMSREALRRIGCQARIVDFPGERALTALAAGKLDVLYGVLPLPERKAHAWFIGPIDHMRMALYVRRDALPEGGLGRLADVRHTRLRIGIERHRSYGPEYDALRDDAAFAERLRPVVSRDAALAMLATGRLDAVFADAASARRFAPAVVRAVDLTPVPVHLGLSRATIDAARYASLREALDAMATDGTLDRLRGAAGIEGGSPPPDNETPP